MTTNDGRTALVTGGTGFLGGWCIATLLDRGYRVRTTIRDLAREGDVRSTVAAAGAAAPDEVCEHWVAASKAIFEHADMIPLAKWPTNWVFNGAEMSTLGGRPLPVTIRLLAE